MALRFICTKCGEEIVIKYLSFGDTAKCFACGEEVLVPESAQQAADNSSTINQYINNGHNIIKTPQPDSTRAEIVEISGRPICHIWTRPRATTRYLLNRGSRKLALFFAGLYGVVVSLHQVLKHANSLGHDWSVPVVILVNVVFGLFFGVSLLFVLSWALAYISKLFKGRAKSRDIRIALGWSTIAYDILLVLLIPILLLWGEPILFSAGSSMAGVSAAHHATQLYFFARLIMSIWFIVISTVAISEATKLSTGKSLAAIFIAWIITILVGIGTAFLIFGLILK